MEATRLNNAQWEQFVKVLLPIALQKVEIVRIFPKVMVYSSKKDHGLGLKYLWHNQ